jgi:hypothetical protein
MAPQIIGYLMPNISVIAVLIIKPPAAMDIMPG